MAEADQLSFGGAQQRKRLCRSENVLVLVRGRTVHEDESFHDGRPHGKGAKVFEISGRQGLARPFCGHARVRIEILGIVDAAASLIVVAADHHLAEIVNFVDDLVGIRAIAHKVAKTDRHVVLSRGQLKTGVKRFEIGMNVAEQQVTHRVPRG